MILGTEGVKGALSRRLGQFSEQTLTSLLLVVHKDVWPQTRGRNSSVSSALGLLSCGMQRQGIDPPLSLRWKGFFSWSWHWFGLHSLETLLDKSINRGLVYAHMHSITLTQRSWHSCPWRMDAGNKNTPSIRHPRRWNVTTSMAGLEKWSHTKKSPPPPPYPPKNGETQRYSWEHTQKKKKAPNSALSAQGLQRDNAYPCCFTPWKGEKMASCSEYDCVLAWQRIFFCADHNNVELQKLILAFTGYTIRSAQVLVELSPAYCCRIWSSV